MLQRKAGAGIDEATTDHVCRIVGSHHSGGEIDTPEFRIVWDADRLMEGPGQLSRLSRERMEGVIDRVFKTETGRRKAHTQVAQS